MDNIVLVFTIILVVPYRSNLIINQIRQHFYDLLKFSPLGCPYRWNMLNHILVNLNSQTLWKYKNMNCCPSVFVVLYLVHYTKIFDTKSMLNFVRSSFNLSIKLVSLVCRYSITSKYNKRFYMLVCKIKLYQSLRWTCQLSYVYACIFLIHWRDTQWIQTDTQKKKKCNVFVANDKLLSWINSFVVASSFPRFTELQPPLQVVSCNQVKATTIKNLIDRYVRDGYQTSHM